MSCWHIDENFCRVVTIETTLRNEATHEANSIRMELVINIGQGANVINL
jgi:hypothetical protein